MYLGEEWAVVYIGVDWASVYLGRTGLVCI